MARKPLLCRIGRHNWQSQMTEERKTFYVRERYKKTQDK